MEMIKLAEIKSEVDDFLYNNQELKIETKDDYTHAGDVVKQVMNRIKALEEKRKEYTQPLDETKKRIMADFATVSKPLEDFCKYAKDQMVTWARAEQIRLDAEQKCIEAEAMAKAKAEGVSEVSVPIVNEQKSQRGVSTTTTLKKVWKFEIVDEFDIDRKYLMVDERKIREAISGGERKIAGVRVYQDEQISIR